MAAEVTTAIARPLRVLIPLIKEDLEAGNAAGMEHYRRAGEKLIEAKSQIEHGEWAGWVQSHFSVGISQARIYMRLARESQNERPHSFSTLTEMTTPGRTTHCPPYTAGVREILTK
jgi:hypothetical protein